MSKLGNLKKPELVAIATDLGLTTDGVKSDLETRIASYFAENPSIAIDNPKYSGYVTTSSPVKARRRSIKPTTKVLDSVKHSPEDETSATPADIASTSFAKLYTSVTEREQVVVGVSKKFFSSRSKTIKSYYKKATSKLNHASKSARSGLSSVVFLSYFFTIVEFGLLLSTIVPITSKPIVGYTFPLPHFEIVTYWKTFWLPLIVWTLGSLVLPLILSYYINFTGASHSRRSAKSHEFDPFVYAGVRFIVGSLFYPQVALRLISYRAFACLSDVLGKVFPIVSRAVAGYSYFAGITSLLVIVYAAAIH